jgi:hypothetical protein
MYFQPYCVEDSLNSRFERASQHTEYRLGDRLTAISRRGRCEV